MNNLTAMFSRGASNGEENGTGQQQQQQQQQQQPQHNADTAFASAAAVTNLITGVVPVSVREDMERWKDARSKSVRPWLSEFFATSQFAVPKLTEAPPRLLKNLVHFQSNYLVVTVLLLIYAVLSSPLFVVVLAAVVGLWAYAFHFRTEPITVFGRQIPDRLKFAIVAGLSITLLWLFSAGNIIFWLLGASLTVTLTHALFHVAPEAAESELTAAFNTQMSV